MAAAEAGWRISICIDGRFGKGRGEGGGRDGGRARGQGDRPEKKSEGRILPAVGIACYVWRSHAHKGLGMMHRL